MHDYIHSAHGDVLKKGGRESEDMHKNPALPLDTLDADHCTLCNTDEKAQKVKNNVKKAFKNLNV